MTSEDDKTTTAKRILHGLGACVFTASEVVRLGFPNEHVESEVIAIIVDTDEKRRFPSKCLRVNASVEVARERGFTIDPVLESAIGGRCILVVSIHATHRTSEKLAGSLANLHNRRVQRDEAGVQRLGPWMGRKKKRASRLPMLAHQRRLRREQHTFA